MMDLSIKPRKDKSVDRIRIVIQKLNYNNRKVNIRGTRSFTVYSGDLDKVFNLTVKALSE